MKSNLKRLFSVFFIILISISFKGNAQDLEHQIDGILQKQFKSNLPGCAAIVVKDGKTIYRKAFGMANMELDVPMQPKNIFRIGSITKQFTACAILRLAEEGKLALNDDITKFIKDYPTQGNVITIEHLLTHTSGIKSYTSMQTWDDETRKKDFTPVEMIDYFKNQPMDFKPGEEYRYNNSAYFILGYIIELVSGKTYADYIQDNFFKPLEMKNSFYGNTSKIIINRASGYQKNGEEYENARFLSMTQPYSAGSLLSTVDDLAKWYEAVMSYKVVSKESVDRAHTSYILKNGKVTSYGYGWSVGNIQGSPSISHGGGINGFLTASIYLKNEKVFVAVFSNCTSHVPGDVANRIAAISIEKPFEWTSIPLPETTLNEYVGVYESKYDGDRIITVENGKLFSMRTGSSKYEYLPFEKDKFFVKDGFTTLEFKRNKKKKIESVTSKSTDEPILWIRTDKKIVEKKSIQLDTKILESYVGNYELQKGFVLTVTLEEGKLMMHATGQTKNEIFAESENNFFLKVVDAQIEFVQGPGDKAETLILNQGGQKFNCKRID